MAIQKKHGKGRLGMYLYPLAVHACDHQLTSTRQMVQTRQRERVPRSCRLQVDPVEQEIWLPREEQGRPGSLRCTGFVVPSRSADNASE